ncbi:thiamine diphosphokinase [Pontibaca salina]|nr:thiamine diphosphokinase [Pontibaca salina]
MGRGDLELALSHAPVLVAADSGAITALDAGYMPQAVIGDLDSLDAEALARLPAERVHRITEQDSTDFDKALRNISAPVVVGIGFTGGRLDHQLAALNTLVRLSSRPCVLLGDKDLVFHAPRSLQLDLFSGERVSLFPMHAISGRSTGLKWPINGLALAPDGLIGTSNQATGAMTLELDSDGMLVMLPRTNLAEVMRAITLP